jgi:hypothetical protein
VEAGINFKTKFKKGCIMTTIKIEDGLLKGSNDNTNGFKTLYYHLRHVDPTYDIEPAENARGFHRFLVTDDLNVDASFTMRFNRSCIGQEDVNHDSERGEQVTLKWLLLYYPENATLDENLGWRKVTTDVLEYFACALGHPINGRPPCPCRLG